MADTLERTSPLQPWAARFGQLPNSVAIVEEPFVTMVDLRVNPSGPGAAAAAEVLGVELPAAASTYAKNADTTVIWLGPDEWLVTGTAVAGPGADAATNQPDFFVASRAHHADIGGTTPGSMSLPGTSGAFRRLR